jgi:uncharacterized protein (TIGR03382 family)
MPRIVLALVTALPLATAALLPIRARADAPPPDRFTPCEGHQAGDACDSGRTVETRQPPVGGLYALETPPATATSIGLAPAPALVDGDRSTNAGIDLGFGRSVAGDTTPRHVGGQLANALTPVDRISVWVDRALPADVAGAYAWTVYGSDDNVLWTPVALGGPASFDALDDRFEIPIVRTAARYLNVVTRPLPTGVTVDARYSEVLVTEVGFADRSVVGCACVAVTGDCPGGAASCLSCQSGTAWCGPVNYHPRTGGCASAAPAGVAALGIAALAMLFRRRRR